MENLEATDKNGPEHILSDSEIAVDKESGLAIVVIKPDAFANKDQIVQRLEGSGLYVVKQVTKKLPDDFVLGEMYPDLSKGLQEATLEHFNMGPSEIILLEGGPNMVNEIVNLSGHKTKPSQCNPDTIRYLFGEHFMREAGSDLYVRNAIHRPVNEKENELDLKKFKDLL